MQRHDLTFKSWFVLGRLRSAGFNVIDRPRPRVAGTDNLSINHGGVAVIAAAGVVLSTIAVSEQLTTCEQLCVRAVSGRFTAIIVIIYRPRSAAVQPK